MKPSIRHFVSISLPYTIVLIAFFTIVGLYRPGFPILSLFDITAVRWFFSFFILFVFIYSSIYFFDDINKKNLLVIKIYLIWMLICIVRGLFAAENYWDWKGLTSNSLAILLPVMAYASTNKAIVQSLLSSYIKYGLPLFIVLSVLMITDAYGRYLMPISFLLLFLPALSKRQRLLLLVFTAVVLFANIHARSNIIKFGIPFIVLLIYYWQDNLSVKTLERIRLFLIILPLILFSLGASGIFNIFRMSEYLGEFTIEGTDFDGEVRELGVTDDNRTFLYFEIINSAIYNDYWIFGRTPARGNDSEFFGDEQYELTGRDERLGNEFGIANVFTWTGIVGVILYLLIFYRASYLAINRSNNIYAKMMGVYVAFRWFYSWVEDINNFSLNYFMLLLMIGICFSHSFRIMSNYEVTIWARGIFDKRYLNFYEHLKEEENGEE